MIVPLVLRHIRGMIPDRSGPSTFRLRSNARRRRGKDLLGAIRTDLFLVRWHVDIRQSRLLKKCGVCGKWCDGEAMQTYLVISRAGPNRDLSKGAREQPFWDEHAAVHRWPCGRTVHSPGRPAGRRGRRACWSFRRRMRPRCAQKLEPDPWYQRGILSLESIRRWQIFIDQRAKVATPALTIGWRLIVLVPIDAPSWSRAVGQFLCRTICS